MRNDLRDALRALRNAPAFSVVAILTLALAIGSATAVFSIVDAVFVRGLPYARPGQLETVYERSESGNLRVPSFPTFEDWRNGASAVRDAIDGFAFVRGDGTSVPGPDGPERQIAAYVTPGFFQLLGGRPLIGRLFTPDDERAGAPRVAVISFDFFMRHFGGDASAVGKTIVIDSMPTTVVGVMPRGFAFPNFGSGGWLPPAFWQPIATFQATHQALSLRGLHVDSRAILRLHAGADSARANAAMRTIQQRLALEYPNEQAHWTSIQLRSLPDELFGGLGATMRLIGGAVALIVLLACANVANLLLVRSSARSRELAVRSALGAGRWRLTRHRLVEASVIAIAAGAVGITLATVLVSLVRSFAVERLPFATAFGVDAPTAGFLVAATAAVAILIGILPALQSERGDLVVRLRGAAAGLAGGVAERHVRNLLVSLQVALAITVLVGAGLLIQSLRRIAAVPLGYDDAGVVGFSFAAPKGKYDSPAQAATLYARVIDAMRAVPGVSAVAAAGGALLDTKVETEGHAGDAAPPTALYHPISADFLRIIKVPIVRGRGFTEDDMRVPSGFLVTQNLASQLWPGADPLGRTITVHRASQARADFGQPITLPVIGVVADYHEYGPENDPPRQVFLPYTLEVWPWMQFVVRSRDPAGIVASLKKTVTDVEPAIRFMSEPRAPGTGRAAVLRDPRMFVAGLMSAFAVTALLLAAIGLYGIVAYGVAQRTREIGVRIAVGARGRDVLQLILGHAARLTGAGIIVGLVAAVATTRVVQSMLFQTSTTDVVTLVVVPLLLAAVAAVASAIPAIRATRIDPIIVMRSE